MTEGPPPVSARERDTDAIVTAAMELFAQSGPAATSLRAVAAKAGVNYGLIHQYVGTKEDLLALVLQRVSLGTAGRLSAAASLDGVVREVVRSAPTTYVRMVARTLLDGRDPATLIEHSPAMRELVERVIASSPDAAPRDEVAVGVVALMSLAMGWRLFGRFLQSAAGLEDLTPDELSERIAARAVRLL